jgi:hypothetical protein
MAQKETVEGAGVARVTLLPMINPVTTAVPLLAGQLVMVAFGISMYLHLGSACDQCCTGVGAGYGFLEPGGVIDRSYIVDGELPQKKREL